MFVAAPPGLAVEEILPAPIFEENTTHSIVTGLELERLARQQVASVMWESALFGDVVLNGALRIPGATSFGEDPLEARPMAGHAKIGVYTEVLGGYAGAEWTSDPDYDELALWHLHATEWDGWTASAETALFGGSDGLGLELEMKLIRPLDRIGPLGPVSAQVTFNTLFFDGVTATLAPGVVAEPLRGHRLHVSVGWPMLDPSDLDAVQVGVAWEAQL